MNFLLIFLFTYNYSGGFFSDFLFKSTQHGHWLSFLFVFWMRVCINLFIILPSLTCKEARGWIHLTKWYLHWGKTGVLFNVTYIHSKTGSSIGTTILSGQEKEKLKKTFIWRKSYTDRWRDFILQIWWYAVQLQRDSLNSFKGCLWRQKHWWQLTFITSLKPFQIGVWNSGFASFPCRTCTHANFRKIFESLQSGEFHAG